MSAKTIAIMQPYFMPYAGYFRLMAAADVFVIYDCVQFPKGGWVHRNRMPDGAGRTQWLTLPINRPHLGTHISDLTFMPDAKEVMGIRLSAFPDISARIGSDPLLSRLMNFDRSPLRYLRDQLEATASYLGLSTEFVLASNLELTDTKPAAGRVIEMIQKLKGKTYINAPGGRGLYDATVFAAAGIELRFLTDYPGSMTSMLYRLIHESAPALRDEIFEATQYQ